ncbi:uncharacterized protein [Cicer arietinum]|uniref:Uncharacterized protein LOC101496282 n=1 Tax=Cicer arietinum TaxID=3827 RepID=A0A1S2Z067_CICAR|nr:uncharacterized protein LOC101496282 [Cicer arietinum]
MPSGPKKRKAAKRKKEKENNNIKLSQSEKGSDGREFNSSANYEHSDHHDHPFNYGSEEVKERDPSAARSNTSDVMSVEEVRGTSNGKSLAEKNSKDEIYNLHEEKTARCELVKSDESSPSDMNTVKVISSVELEETSGNSAVEYSINSVKTAASMSEVEKCDTGSVPLNNSAVPPIEVTDLALKTNGYNVDRLKADENAKTSSLEKPMPKESDSKVLTSSTASSLTKFTNGAEHTKNSETLECPGNKHTVSLAPNMVQKTSFWSCCGLFEVMSRSNK